MSNKPLFDDVELQKNEEITDETIAELSNNKGDDE